MKRLLSCFIFLCLLPLAALAEAAADPPEAAPTDYLTPYAELAGLPIEPEALAHAQYTFTPETVELCGVEVRFEQLVCDGSWVLACATASAEDIMILPGAATLDRPACGDIFVPEGADTRTFCQVARDTGREVLSVYVYLEEFDGMGGGYFLDHSISEDKTVLYSGTQLPQPADAPIDMHWTVQVYAVNLDTNRLTPIETASLPVTVTPILPEEE